MWFSILSILAGLALALISSRRAIDRLSELAAKTSISPFFFGITLVSIGTDLPEIANSLVASLSNHGDLNVGDSIGSVATQITLVLGLLPFFVGRFPSSRNQVALIGGVTVLSLGMGLVLFSDGYISRADGLILILAWLMASLALWRQGSLQPTILEKKADSGSGWRLGLYALFYLALVAVGATVAVQAFVDLASDLSIPEYLISFFAASIGTSLPELFVDVTALRRGERELAIGDIFGSSMVDATLSVGIGPFVAPTAITASLAVRGSLVAMAAVAIATALLVLCRMHSRVTGGVLLLAYAAVYPALLLLGA